MILGLIGCSKSKHGEGTDQQFEASQIYDSWLFDYRSEAAEVHTDRWFILSAEHELLAPDTEISYYDTTMDERDPQQWAAAVADQMQARHLHQRFDSVLILAGRDYVDPLLPHLERFQMGVWDPMEGVRLFSQREQFPELIEAGRDTDQTDLGSW